VDAFNFDLGFLLKYIPVLFIGLKMTLLVSVLATLLGIGIGLIGGLGLGFFNVYLFWFRFDY